MDIHCMRKHGMFSRFQKAYRKVFYRVNTLIPMNTKSKKESNMKTKINKPLLGLSGIVVLIFFLGWIDLETGYELNFFVFYFIPVSMAAWFFGIEWAIAFSLVCACIWFVADIFSGHIFSTLVIAISNTVIRLISFLIIGWSIHKISVLFQSEKNKADKLNKALLEIKKLESFLSICCVCKKIRNKDGTWQQLESYISKHSDTKFSHGYCPECSKKAMDELDESPQ